MIGRFQRFSLLEREKPFNHVPICNQTATRNFTSHSSKYGTVSAYYVVLLLNKPHRVRVRDRSIDRTVLWTLLLYFDRSDLDMLNKSDRWIHTPCKNGGALGSWCVFNSWSIPCQLPGTNNKYSLLLYLSWTGPVLKLLLFNYNHFSSDPIAWINSALKGCLSFVSLIGDLRSANPQRSDDPIDRTWNSVIHPNV